MATKIEKRSIRKQKQNEALGITETFQDEPKKMKQLGDKKVSEGTWRWLLFLIQILLLIFIFTFRQ